MAIDAISRLDAVPGRFGGKRRWVNWSFTHRDDWRRVQREDLVTIGGHLAYRARDGRLVVCDKRPCDPRSGRPAKVNDPGTWGTLEEARATVAEGRAEGVAYALDEDEVLIDLDGCIDDQGQVSAAARVVVEKLDSYTERSVSGRGLHGALRRTGLQVHAGQSGGGYGGL